MIDDNRTIRALLIEDDEAYAYLIGEFLAPQSLVRIRLQVANRLEAGRIMTAQTEPDIVLLDLGLPDSTGLATFSRFREVCPDVPVIVLSGLDDERTAYEAVQMGAQDYLVKGDFDGRLLRKAILYALERSKLLEELRHASITDPLTRLYNRRGFEVMALQQLKIAAREHKPVHLIFADMDGLKEINDNLGHKAGDDALVDLTTVLGQTYRDYDVISRIGGDEFAIVVCGMGHGDVATLISRLQWNIGTFNSCVDRPYRLSVSVGAVTYDPAAPSSLDDLLTAADQQMYAVKEQKKQARRA